MKIVINADDMGYTSSISQGIREGYRCGLVSSSTVMSHMPFAASVPELLKDTPIPLGCHLTLTCGKPLTGGKSLVNEEGNFWKYRDFYSRTIDVGEAYAEFKAQIEKFIEIFERRPTHLDSHQGCTDGVSVLLKNNPELASKHNTKEIYEMSLALAKEYDLPLRRNCEFEWTDVFYGENATVETIIRHIENNRDKDIEFMVHPAYCDLELYRRSSYNTYRVKELDALCDQRLIDYFLENDIDLVDFTGRKKDLRQLSKPEM